MGSLLDRPARPGVARARSSSRMRVVALRVLAACGIAVCLLYGLLAVDAARIIGQPLYVADSHALVVAREQVSAGTQDATVGLNESPAWIIAAGHMASHAFAFDRDSYFHTQYVHYARMPKANAAMLAVHVVLGGACMLGALQFWPWFRRRYPRGHRGIGVAYLLAAQLAMLTAAYAMATTPIREGFDQFSFLAGLWMLVVIVSVALWLSVHHLRRREYGRHQGWMAISFGALLTAPMARYDWILFAVLDHRLNFAAANYLTSAILLPQCFLIGYALLCCNRIAQESRPVRAQAVKSPRIFIMAALVAVLAGIATIAVRFLLHPGLAAIDESARLIPAGVLALDLRVVAGDAVSRWVFALASMAGLAFGAGFLLAAFPGGDARIPVKSRRAAAGLALCAAVAAVPLLHWASASGPPSASTIAGGGYDALYAALLLLFASLLGVALVRRWDALAKEWGIAAICALLAMPLFHWSLALLRALPVPAQFVAAGHVYRLAADTGALSLLAAYVYCIYGEATAGKIAR